MNESILVVIVLYNTRLEDSISYNSLVRSGLKFYIYDNSPSEFGQGKLCENVISYIHDSSNPGLSYAYNKAAEFAKQNGFKWLLICDQDTQFPHGLIEEYESCVNANPDIHLFCPKVRIRQSEVYMSPVRMMHYSAKPDSVVPSGRINLKSHVVINSGILVKVRYFFNVGGYNEAVKLDFSDIQFIERFAHKYTYGYVINQECSQGYSNVEQSIEEKLKRFELFCKSLKGYRPINKSDKLRVVGIVIKRTLSLSYEARSLKPIKLMLNNYW